MQQYSFMLIKHYIRESKKKRVLLEYRYLLSSDKKIMYVVIFPLRALFTAAKQS